MHLIFLFHQSSYILFRTAKQEHNLIHLFIILPSLEILEYCKHLKIVKEIKMQHFLKPLQQQ